MTTPQCQTPYTPCSRAAQEHAFSLFDDPFSDDWMLVARAFDAGRAHMAHQMARTLHPASRAWGSSVVPAHQPTLPAALITVKTKSYGPAFAEVYLALSPIKTQDEISRMLVVTL